MTKRLVDIDDVILEEAHRALGTTTLQETVNESLRTLRKPPVAARSPRRTSRHLWKQPRICVIRRSWQRLGSDASSVVERFIPVRPDRLVISERA